jgi:hypothetical protein
MSNALTGDYDAVVEVNREAINCVLATIHQNGRRPTHRPCFYTA